MGLGLKNIRGLILTVFLLFSVSTCGFDGKVFVTFHWADSEVPTNFATTIPNVPSNIATLNRSQLYRTLPGTFTVYIDYLPGPATDTQTVTLKSGVAIIGEEDYYYDIVLSKLGITVRTVP